MENDVTEETSLLIINYVDVLSFVICLLYEIYCI